MFEYLDKRLHILYFITAIFLGVFMAFLTPLGAIPDETSHLAKIATVSAGEWIGIPSGGFIRDIPEGVANVPAKISANQLMSISEEIRDAFHRPLECSRETRDFHTNIIGYSPLPFLLATLNYMGLCAADATFGTFLYSSRLINLLVAALLISVGIRYAGMGRWSLAAVGLLPMTMYMLPSVSADSLVIAASICYIGIISGVKSRGSVLTGNEFFLLAFSALLLGLSKPGVAWLLALVLVCYPIYRRERKSFKPIFIVAGLLPLILHLLMLRRGSRYSMINVGGGANPDVNLHIILDSPLQFFQILSNTYFFERGDDLLRSLIGNLGWENVPPTQLTIWSVSAALLLSIALNTRSEQGKWPLGTRAYIVALSVVSLILFAIPLYVTYTVAGGEYVYGLQGRYFIPTAALLLPAVGFFVSRKSRNVLAPLALVLVVLGNISAMHSLFNHFYFDEETLTEKTPVTEWVPAQQHRRTIPLWLNQGETVSGEFSWEHTGLITDIGVLIGTAFNTADGLLHLQICNAFECAELDRNLAESHDNKYFHFRFKHPLGTTAGSVLRYQIRLNGGVKPVALWTRETTASTGGEVYGARQPPENLTPQFVIEYQREQL